MKPIAQLMSTLRKLRSFLLILLSVSALLSSAPALAQTTGAIKGTVIDDGGIDVPGVLLTIQSDALIGGAQQQTTDDKGRFQFVSLPPGIYSLSAEKAGFAKKSYPNLQVLIGRNVILTIEMEVRTAGTEIVIDDERPAIDTEKASGGAVLTKEFLEKVPTGRSYQQAVASTPGSLPGSNPSMSGAAYNENTYMVDGVNITDAVTGTFSTNFNFDAIEQIEVITNAFDPEYPSNLGGIINIVTDTGGNNLEFDTSVYYQNANWAPQIDARYAADGAELAPTGFDSEYSTVQINAKVSGPIIRDKAWFVVSYSMERSLIANTGIDLPRDYEGHYILAKVTTQPNAANRISLFFQADPTTIDNQNQSSRFVKPEAQNRQAQGGWIGSLQWDWFPTPDIVVESKANYQLSYIENYGVPCTHNRDLGYNPCQADEPENSLDLVTPGRDGQYNAFDSGNYIRYYFDDRTRYRVESKASFLGKDNIPVLKGNHDFKVGVAADVLRMDQVQGITGDLYYADLNETTYDPDTYKNFYWVEYSGAYDILMSGEHYGAFAQDVYKPIDNLTFRYGLRWDRSLMRSNLRQAIVDINVVAPRFYAIWDPWGDEKTKFVGGYGRFNAIGNLGVASDLNSSPGFGSKLYLGEYFGEYMNDSALNYSVNPPQNTDTVHDYLFAPHSDEFTVSAERQVIQDLVVGSQFIGKFTRNIYVYDETNIIWDEDGFSFIGTSNGQVESRYRLRTPTVSRRDYYSTDVFLRKVESNRWSATVNYRYSVSRGTILTAGNGGLAVPPQAKFSYGNLGSDVRHQIVAYGWWDVPNDPWTTRLGAQVRYYSGYPISRYYYSGGYGSNAILREPLGTYARMEPQYFIDLQVSQAIKVPKGQFRVVAIMQNVVNAHQADQYNGSYIYNQNRWVITSRQTPMQIQLGLRYQF
ncbi:MAG: TonB-dependent receptor [Alphaproteobacteria bacterium]|nr:TonB-dependent receptor [Alphaproteobacteria bacterium]